MYLRTTVATLARWLESEGGAWHIEGEPSLSSSLPLPAPASGVIDALRRRAGAIALLVADENAVKGESATSPDDISAAVHVVDGERVFQCAWIRPDGTLEDSWLLAEQQGLSGMRRIGTGAAARVIAAFRAQKRAASR